MLELTMSNLDTICDHMDEAVSPKYDRIFAGYQLIPPAMVQHHIDSANMRQELKKRHNCKKR
eukprot:15326863-Ditylum_brightwellii.AAC.1